MKRNAISLIFFITFAFTGGILLSPTLGEFLSWILIPASVLAAIAFIWSSRSFHTLPQKAFPLLLMLAVAAGGSRAYQHITLVDNSDISWLTGQEITLDAEVLGNSKSTPYGQKALLRSLDTEISGKFMLYLKEEHGPLHEGEIVQTTLTVKELKSAYPSYLAYLNRKDIYAAASCQSITVTGQAGGIMGHLARFRQGLGERIFSSMPDEQMAGITVAMLLGDRSELDPEVREAFSQAGLAHILAISGMHVGLIFLFLKSIFAFLLPGARFGKSRKILVLLILVTYALLTGGSPAVCRAVFMFGLLILAEVFHLQKSRFHILAASALVLLLVDPRMIFDPGFQLSYAAVAGIMLCASPLRDRILERFAKVPRTFATLISVSLCAQAFTAPLIILHFGEFPTYFLLSNLILLPLAAWAVRLGFVSLFLVAVPGLSDVLFQGLDLMLWALVEGTQGIASLPAAVTREVSLTDPGFVILCSMTLIMSWLLYAEYMKMPFQWAIKQLGGKG